MLRSLQVASFAVATFVAASCGADAPAPRAVQPQGPPEVRLDAVADHAHELDRELPEREAGSQEELAAASYILGHLQQAGYVVQLDYVPVANLVRSTNVVALPPAGDPAVVVAVSYDTAPGETSDGAAVGMFLELARALALVDPDHHVQFAALGANAAEVEPGELGSRRLIRRLLDEGLDPEVVVLGPISIRDGDRSVTVWGRGAERLKRSLEAAKGEAIVAVCCKPEGRSVFERAGFEATFVAGAAAPLGSALLEYLSSAED